MVSLNRRFLATDPVLYPSSWNGTNDSQPQESDFDANMVIVLAALLCALIAALALNSLIHFAIRRRRDSMEDIQGGGMGLENQAIRKIPVAVFRSRANVPTTECSICLGDFVDGEKIRVLPECNHEFHVKCVDKWLVEHTSCPNCRHSLVPFKVAEEVSGTSGASGNRGQLITLPMIYTV